MPPVGFEPIISAGDRPQTYTLDRAATGIEHNSNNNRHNNNNRSSIERLTVLCTLREP